MFDRRQRLADALDRRLGSVHVAVESVYHRHNVSAILRTSDAMGVQHIHLIGNRFQPSHGTARGTERWLDVHMHPSPSDAISELRKRGFAIWVADLSPDSVPPEQVPLDRPVCLWFGAELVGVGPEARAAADGVVTVPMYGLAQSLNVSVAAALTLRPVADRWRAKGDRLDPEDKARIWREWIAREDHMVDGIRERTSEEA